ncbi:MAG TPA: 30S ribosomal protein S5 [Synergistaceae bacterium]|jgi:small subunit ribosomal protein S5|nr:30S ribosomal protein S5 [Synergistaceae bacterium]HPJ25153.1 30S ribosomal protein S5 [Synergistaceae bacterium]HPQ36775.1 30S ribosomal protein S5 [Synergistaceae bacterium]
MAARNEGANRSDMMERVVSINRVSKVVKGGKRFKFSVLVVVGDGESRVGVGMGKAKEISEAVRKGIDKAKRNMVDLKQVGSTIPHPIIGRFGAARVLLKPAAPGTGVIAGGAVRAIMELGGVKDVLTKVIGRTSNAVNVAHATMQAIETMRTPEEIRRFRGLEKKEKKEQSLAAEGA